jgi:hypothetical protein
VRARNPAIAGVAIALVIGAIAYQRRRLPVETRAVETTRVVRVVRRDGMGLPEKKALLREPAHVRSLTEALGVDGHPIAECPADYAEAELGIVLSGGDVYARRNVYVFGLLGDAGTAPRVVSVTSAGCRSGPPADLPTLRSELHAAGVLD